MARTLVKFCDCGCILESTYLSEYKKINNVFIILYNFKHTRICTKCKRLQKNGFNITPINNITDEMGYDGWIER
jgi:hypothetical protein